MDGSIGKPATNHSTKKLSRKSSVEQKLGINRQPIYGWLKHSKKIMDVLTKSANKTNNLRGADYPKLENALITFIKRMVDVLRKVSIFRKDVLRRKALEIRDAMVLKLESQKVGANEEQRNMVSQEIKVSLELKVSTHWFHNFKQKKCLKSMKPLGELGMLIPGEVKKLRVKSSKMLCTLHPENIINSGEDAVLFRSFPSRCI